MKTKILFKACLVAALAGIIGVIIAFDLQHYLTLNYLKDQQAIIDSYYQANIVITIVVYTLIYILVTALSIPGAAVLTLFGGAVFGLAMGTIVISFASTTGATLAFIISRFLLRDFIQKQFGDKLKTINEGIKKEGEYYLFTLRLVPVFPFFLINLVMGLTPIKTVKYFFVSQVGMLPGTIVFVFAGTQLARIESLQGIFSPGIIIAFSLLGLFPLAAKKMLSVINSRKIFKKYPPPKEYDYNIAVIGGGAAGLVTSYISAAVKAKVVLIEKHKMGGDCLNTGCVPSKALIRSAKMLSYADRHKEFGFKNASMDFDFKQIMERVAGVIKKIEPHDSVERYNDLGVECLHGHAQIIDPYRIKVNDRVITTKNIVVASGARPFVPPIPGLDKIEYLTSDTLWSIRKLPKRLIILGGGPIGCEMAQSFARFGASVFQVEMLPRIMIREDQEVSDLITEKFRKENITVLTNHQPKKFVVEQQEKILICENNRKEVQIPFDQVIIAVGRKANIAGFGLEELGIEVSDNGAIQHDPYLTTNFPNIFVCGDVTGTYQLTHTAGHQAWYAAVNALFRPFKKFKADYRVIPWCTFTDPEVARVGINEQDAKMKDIPYETTIYGIDELDRAIADSEDHGFVKVLTVPGKDKILGATIVGEHAGELISEFILAMKYSLGLNKLLATIHIYPTMSEANKYAAGNWKKNHIPEKIMGFLKKFHDWRR